MKVLCIFMVGVIVGIYHAEIGTGIADANRALSASLNWYVNGGFSPKE